MANLCELCPRGHWKESEKNKTMISRLALSVRGFSPSLEKFWRSQIKRDWKSLTWCHWSKECILWTRGQAVMCLLSTGRDLVCLLAWPYLVIYWKFLLEMIEWENSDLPSPPGRFPPTPSKELFLFLQRKHIYLAALNGKLNTVSRQSLWSVLIFFFTFPTSLSCTNAWSCLPWCGISFLDFLSHRKDQMYVFGTYLLNSAPSRHTEFSHCAWGIREAQLGW